MNAHNNMDKYQNYYTAWGEKKDTKWFILYDFTHMKF